MGQCVLRMGKAEKIAPVLGRLRELANLRSREITYGDCFNFLGELIEKGLYLHECLELLEFFLMAQLSSESNEKAIRLRERVEQRLRFGETP